MGYKEKIAKKHKIPYMTVERIYIGNNYNTYLESDGSGKWQLISPKSIFKIKNDGGLYISGNVKIDSPLEIEGNLICKKKITAEFIEDKSKSP